MGVPSDIEAILAELDGTKANVASNDTLIPTCRHCEYSLVDEPINVTEVFDECKEYGTQYATEGGSLTDIDYEDRETTGKLVVTYFGCPNCGYETDSWDEGETSLMVMRPTDEG